MRWTVWAQIFVCCRHRQMDGWTVRRRQSSSFEALSRYGFACTFSKTHLLTFIVIFDWAPLAAKACFVFIQSICPLHKYLQHIPSNIYLLIYTIEKCWILGELSLGIINFENRKTLHFQSTDCNYFTIFSSSNLVLTARPSHGPSTSMSSERPLNPYWQLSGHWLDRFLENLSKIEHLVDKWYWKKSGAWQRPISGKLVHIWIERILVRKNTGWVFQKSVDVTIIDVLFF